MAQCMENEKKGRFLTWKPILLAVGVLVLSAWLVQKVELLYAGPSIADGVFPAVPVAVLALLALGAWRLDRGDRAVFYAAVTVGLPVTASGLMHRFLPALVTGFYGGFASPTGRYAQFLEQIPPWLAPGGPNSAAAIGAFEGAHSVPWSDWVFPLLFWLFFFLALFLTSFCLVGILRTRWLETERMGFPLLGLPLGLLGADEEKMGLYRRRAFWWGVAVPVVLFGVNGLHHYFPSVGEISIGLDLGHFLLDPPWRSMASFTSPFRFEVTPALVGVAYLMPVEVSFSTWFFFLLTRLQLLLAHLAGTSEEHGVFVGLGSQWLDWPNTVPFFMSQARGGLIVLALVSLWAARRVFQTAFVRFEWPARGLVAGFCMLWGWLFAVGLSPGVGFWTLASFLLFAIAFARLRVDGGLPVTGVPVLMGYLFFLVFGTGPGVFEDQTYVIFAFLAVLSYTSVGLWPGVQFEGLKLAERTGVPVQRMVWAMFWGVGIGLVVGAIFSLNTIYEYGIFALDQQGGGRTAARIGRYYHYLYGDVATQQGGTDWYRLAAHAAGGAVTWILVFLRGRFLRWPLHPIGYVYGTGFGWTIWGAALVGWFCKWLVAQYGGATTYRKVRPFFLGMIFSEVSMRLFWAGVAMWRGEMGSGYGM
ncbi:MAG: hypothetical protein O2954_00490 [bacterium]|nr:hypothetical protein [bacterium]